MKFLGPGIVMILVFLAAAARGQALSRHPEGGDRWLGRDKAAHFAVSLALTGYSYHLLRCEQEKSRGRSRNISAAITLGWGLSKETKDAASPGNHFCFKDLTADLLGLAAGMIIFTTNK